MLEPDHVIIIEDTKWKILGQQGTARITASNLFEKRAFAVSALLL